MPTVPHNDPKAFEQWYDRGYFRRPRAFFRARRTLNYALLLGCLAVVAVTLWPRLHGAYQAGALSNPHAPFNDNCSACHAGFAPTARRLIPVGTVHATPDAKCLQCHEAGNHNPHQLENTGAEGMSSGCAGCHREHRGAVSIARIDDAFCTRCHADLKVDDNAPRFATQVAAFAAGAHPEFGAWRTKTSLPEFTDPGTLKFNHAAHLNFGGLQETIDKLKPDDPRRGAMREHLAKLKEQSCTFCHQPDSERRFMLPLRYDAQCKGCHPLAIRPAGDWPEADIAAWMREPLPHPGRGQNAEVVRGALVEKYARVLKRDPTKVTVQQPAVVAPLTPEAVRAAAKDLGRKDELVYFAGTLGFQKDALQDRGYVVNGSTEEQLARELFDRPGCMYCHQEADRAARADGLPKIQSPKLRGRWDDIQPMPDNRFGPSNAVKPSEAEQFNRDRWFPYSRFNHQPHRMMDCVACHQKREEDRTAADQAALAKNPLALVSRDTRDVLMPRLALCAKCHHTGTGGVRADCLECHQYHDRSKEPHGLRGTRTIESIEALMRPGGQ